MDIQKPKKDEENDEFYRSASFGVDKKQLQFFNPNASQIGLKSITGQVNINKLASNKIIQQTKKDKDYFMIDFTQSDHQDGTPITITKSKS